jgi:hypothetical protein
MLALLRPHPHRGDVVAAGTVVLTLFVQLVTFRFGGEWDAGVRLLFTAVLAAPVLIMAFQADAGDELPRPYEAVLYVASFVLLLSTLVNLADVLGSEGGAGTVVWVGLLVMAYCLWFARRRNSAIMTLLAALTAVVVVIAFVDWVFDIGSATTVEWLLFGCALALTVGAVHQRDARRRHAVSLVDAAGLTILALGFIVALDVLFTEIFGLFAGSLFGESGSGFTGGPAGWELVLLAFGFGLIAYGCVDRERVPVGIGIAVLNLFLGLAFAPGEGGPSLIGWPIVLALLAVALLVIGLRPRQDLPPEPDVPTLPGAGR